MRAVKWLFGDFVQSSARYARVYSPICGVAWDENPGQLDAVAPVGRSLAGLLKHPQIGGHPEASVGYEPGIRMDQFVSA